MMARLSQRTKSPSTSTGTLVLGFQGQKRRHLDRGVGEVDLLELDREAELEDDGAGAERVGGHGRR